MSVKRLNRGGPLSFSQLATGSPYCAINNLLENVDVVVPTQNISLSSSLARLKAFTGDPNENVKNDAGVGAGLVSFNNINDAKMSEFYGANFLSASIKPQGNGVWYAQFYPDSTVYNSNYLTTETSSRIYRYSVYSKSNPPGLETFTKQSSYVLSNDAEEYLVNLTNDRIYKVVLKDVVSNAFTSSFFTGSCAQPSTVGSSVAIQSNTSANITAARDNIIANIAANTILNSDRKYDLTTICNELPSFIANPSGYTLTGYVRSFTKPGLSGGTRTFELEGFIARSNPNGNYYAGLVTCSGGNGTPTYEYGIDEVSSTLNQSVIKTFALAPTTTAVGCGSAPARSVSNTAATQNCSCPAQTTCAITTISQVHYTGSMWITNPNAESVDVTLNNDWINSANNGSLNAGNQQLLPSISPSSITALGAGASKKVSIKFGESHWGQSYQSSSFSAKGTFTITFGDASTKTGYITANWNKNVCVPSSTGEGGDGGCPASWMLMETKEKGFIPAKDIEVGMHLRGPDENEWNKVTVAYEAQAPIWRTVIDGDTYDVDSSHLWYIGNGVWKCVKALKPGDAVEGSYGQLYTVDSNELLLASGNYMHLNCENHRFLMLGKAIGHNSTLITHYKN